MSVDVFTGLPLVDASEEHVLQNALGGRLKHAWLERSLNSTFGETIDAALARFVHAPRVLLNARSGDGEEPAPLKNLECADGQRYNVLPGGLPELARPTVTVEKQDGALRIEGSVRSEKELRRLLQRVLKKHNVDFESLREHMRHESAPVESLRMSFQFNDDVRRAMMKSACNLLAVRDREMFAGSEFDAARSFVLNGGRSAAEAVVSLPTAFDIYKQGRGLGPLDHMISVRIDPDTGEVDGLFTIFRHIQFFLAMGRVSPGRTLATTYRVDQLGRAVVHDGARDVSLILPPRRRIFQASEASRIAGYRSGVERLLCALRGDGVAADGASVDWLGTMVEEVTRATFEDMGLREGDMIERAHTKELSRRIAHAFVAEIDKRGLWNRVRIPTSTP